MRGISYKSLSPLERLVLYERYTQERMAQVTCLTAQVMASVDAKQAGAMLNKYMDALFPEVAHKKEATTKDMLKELEMYSKKDIILVQGSGGLTLEMKDKKKG